MLSMENNTKDLLATVLNKKDSAKMLLTQQHLKKR